MHRHAFSLIEVVVCVLLLAIAIPPSLELLGAAASDRTDTVNANRAALLATTVLETIIADVASPDPALGYAALADAAAYTDHPVSGLRARLESLTEHHDTGGLAYTVTIGEPVDVNLTVNADPEENIYRLVTVTVVYHAASVAERSMPVSVLVAQGWEAP